VNPFGSTSGRFHGSALFRTQLALWENAESADPAQPAAFWDFLDAVTRLVRNVHKGPLSIQRASSLKKTHKRVSDEGKEEAYLGCTPVYFQLIFNKQVNKTILSEY